MSTLDAVIVGGGPRAVATVLRVAARVAQARTRPARLALVDAVAVGAGATWRIDQPAAYLNNTQAHATTIHPDDSTRMSGPPAPGPDLVEWAREVADLDSHPTGQWVVQEARALTPDSFPTRRLQGVYFRDQLEAAIAAGHVEIEEHHATVVDLEREIDHERTSDLTTAVLADGTRLTAPTMVLAQGMVQARRTPEVAGLLEVAQRFGLRYVEPGMPAERTYTGLPAGETVLVRGLGANFFDVIGQLVDDWGGTFEPAPGDDPTGRLRYVPSGREARLVVGSRRGVLYRSKPDGGRPTRPFTARWATGGWFEALAERADVDFRQDVWPALAREFARCYLEALAEFAGPAAVDGDWMPLLDAAQSVEETDEVLAGAIRDPRWRWTIQELHRPTSGRPVTPQEWQEQVARLIEDELGSMSNPGHHPRAAVNSAMGALRKKVAALTRSGALSGQSLARDVLGWFDGDALALASGPPAGRVREVLALIEAGIIDLLGPGLVIEADEKSGEFLASSPITGRIERSRVLLETRMSKGKIPETDDPLLRSLLDSGRACLHTVDGVPTASMEATAAQISESVTGGHHLVAADGSIDESVVVIGIPAQSTQPGSAIGATPGVPSPLLAGADIAAQQILVRVASGAPLGVG